VKVLIFSLNGVKYGIEASKIKEVIKTEKITSIPNTPDFVEGVISFRGKIVPMINLARRLGMTAKCVEGSIPTIILKSRQGKVGLIVDEVSEITDFTAEDIMPNVEREKFFKGIVKLPDDTFVLLLDSEKILQSCSLDTILTFLPVPVIIHDGKKILFANQKAIDIFGLKEIDDVVKLAHPDRRHLMREQIERVLRGEKVEPSEELIVTSEGKEIWLEVTHTIIPGSSAIVSIFRNVAERKPEQEVDVLGIANENGVLVYVSPHTADNFGVCQAGKPLSEIFPFGTVEQMLQCVKNAINGNKIVISQNDKEAHTTNYYIPLTSLNEKYCLILSQKRTDHAKQRMLLRKAVEVSEVMVSTKNKNEVMRRAEDILADYNARISDHPENLSFTINHNGRRYGHLNVKSELDDDEKYVFRTLAKNLGFALKSIEDKEKLLDKLSENIGLIACLIDRIRNPLAAIMGYAEFIEDENIKQKIVGQIERIVGIISKLDFAWINSEDVLKKLQADEQDKCT